GNSYDERLVAGARGKGRRGQCGREGRSAGGRCDPAARRRENRFVTDDDQGDWPPRPGRYGDAADPARRRETDVESDVDSPLRRVPVADRQAGPDGRRTERTTLRIPRRAAARRRTGTLRVRRSRRGPLGTRHWNQYRTGRTNRILRNSR